MTAFSHIKTSLANSKSLATFNKDAETILVVDASPFGLGAVSFQKEGKEERVISYGSCGLTEVESRYSQTEKEALAIVWACKHFYSYLYGTEFELRS